MIAPNDRVAADAHAGAATDSQPAPLKASRKAAPLREADLLAKLFWSVPESAFMCGLGVRTVWRLVADPKSNFPRPRRVGKRTLLSRDAVLAFMAGGSAR